MTPLLALPDAQARLLALGTPLPLETVGLHHAIGRWAARDVVARRTQPAEDLSAMDGYAIRHRDLPGPLRVVGESAAGRGFGGSLDMGQAVRIFTGAPLPDGADCVLIQEEAVREGDEVRLAGAGPAVPGEHVRRRGFDFSAGERLIAAGERMTPARIALAAIGGIAELAVRRRVRVAIAATGDELVRPGEPGFDDPTKLPEANVAMVAAQLAGLPCEVDDLGILPDRRDALAHAFAQVDADILVTVGGASVGDHDLVRPALEQAGGTLDFWRVALRPGKPMLAGRLGRAVVVGLPGNPVSSFVATELFVKPLVARLAGAADPLSVPTQAPLGMALPANGARADYLRGTLLDGRVHVAPVQDSSMLATLARSTCLVVRPPHAPALPASAMVPILPLA